MYSNYLIQNDTQEVSCANCTYYYQHYIKSGTQYIMCFAGHCVNKNSKRVKPNHKCENFRKKEDANGITNI